MKRYLPSIAVILMFLGASFIAQRYTENITTLISGNDLSGMFVYFLAIVSATVLAPLTSLPLIPFAVEAWGVWITAVLNILGWAVGAMIAFWIARRYGAPVVQRFASLKNIEKRYRNLPEKNLFWYLIIFRMTTPVDIMSYALGLFTSISWKLYIITTVIGIIPFTLLFIYFGTIPFIWQLLTFFIGMIVLLILSYIRKRKTSHHQ